jgi:hypothetical protein
MVTLAYLSGIPKFSALNVALYDAINGNWTGLSSAGFGPLFAQGLAEVLPIACLDKRKLSSSQTDLSSHSILTRYRRQHLSRLR